MQSCFLCRSDLAPIVAEGEHWRLVLNINQNFLGKCMWVLRRHVEAVPELSPQEWAELHSLLQRTRKMLHHAFQPDHYNYAFLQNQDRHVHLHVIPRYAALRTYKGVRFTDPDWPGHYTALNPPHRLASETTNRLTEHLRYIWQQDNSVTMCPAVFLDLQGTLGGEGLGDIRDFTFYPCALPALRLLNQSGLLAIVVTNQSHIAKGLFTYGQYEARVEELRRELEHAKVRIDAIYCCPHRSPDICACQKPKLGLLHEAQRDFAIDLKECYVIGDMGSSDMRMAHAAGCKGILVRTGAGESSLNEYRHTWAEVEPDFIAADVLEAVEWVIQDKEY